MGYIEHSTMCSLFASGPERIRLFCNTHRTPCRSEYLVLLRGQNKRIDENNTVPLVPLVVEN